MGDHGTMLAVANLFDFLYPTPTTKSGEKHDHHMSSLSSLDSVRIYLTLAFCGAPSSLGLHVIPGDAEINGILPRWS